MIATDKNDRYDCILVGGGLQSGLIALAVKHFHPHAKILMIERAPKIAGNHTWSFHPGDVPAQARVWLKHLIEFSWKDYDVRIGKTWRKVNLEYASVSSDHFASMVENIFAHGAAQRAQMLEHVAAMAIASAEPNSLALDVESKRIVSDRSTENSHLLTNTDVVTIEPTRVETKCGSIFHAPLVIDCRGPSKDVAYSACGFQKFWGFEIELENNWPEESPAVMEGVEAQEDGFRFLYTLPFTPRRVLVEDTRFSDTPKLVRAESIDLVAAYMQRRGIGKYRIVREETGVLPMPFSNEQMPAATAPLSGGYAGGWFHAATGYSFPMAAAFAQAVASGPLATASDRIEALSKQHRSRAKFSRFLNRLLFRLVAPKYRHRIFQRFYRVLNEDAIERFYSHQFSSVDALRIVVGIPPTLFGLRPIRFIRSFLSGRKP
ncbi:MAG: lycopene cyclase family protein [Planctomycetota bacterium]